MPSCIANSGPSVRATWGGGGGGGEMINVPSAPGSTMGNFSHVVKVFLFGGFPDAIDPYVTWEPFHSNVPAQDWLTCHRGGSPLIPLIFAIKVRKWNHKWLRGHPSPKSRLLTSIWIRFQGKQKNFQVVMNSF